MNWEGGESKRRGAQGGGGVRRRGAGSVEAAQGKGLWTRASARFGLPDKGWRQAAQQDSCLACRHLFPCPLPGLGAQAL